jgi:CRP/FNR family transcriptional regulator, cyclic AMP receptor protein
VAVYDRVVPFRKDAKVQLISTVPLLAGCSKSELARIASLADLVDFGEGETLMKEGSTGSEFFIIVDGTVRVAKRGRKLAELKAGGWVGEIALISTVPRTATAVATSPVQALVLTRRGFSELVNDLPSIGLKVLGAVGQRLAEQTI